MSIKRCHEGHCFDTRKYGDVCPYCNESASVTTAGNFAGQDGNLIAARSSGFSKAIEPVVGWLVCTEGPSRGRDYKIKANKNLLGTGDGMDLQILGDNSIAQRNHTVLVYDTCSRSTLLLPGETHGLVYLNDEVLYKPKELSAYDKIGIGNSKFLFVPLCGEFFEWDTP